ncbi:MAG: hypothetical protein AAFO67_08390 [Planctomycetota bacterium]
MNRLDTNQPRSDVIDRDFLEHRAKLIDIAAFLDRCERADGTDDFRLRALRTAIPLLIDGQPERARRILESFSDPTSEPIPEAPGKGAIGAGSCRFYRRELIEIISKPFG